MDVYRFRKPGNFQKRLRLLVYFWLASKIQATGKIHFGHRYSHIQHFVKNIFFKRIANIFDYIAISENLACGRGSCIFSTSVPSGHLRQRRTGQLSRHCSCKIIMSPAGEYFFFSPAGGNILHFLPRWRKNSSFCPPLAGVQGVEKRGVGFSNRQKCVS